MQNNTELSGLLVRRASLAAQKVNLEAKIKKLRTELTAIGIDVIDTENALSLAKLRGEHIPFPLGGAPSRRSLASLKVWASLYEAIANESDHAGLPNHLAQKAIERVLPDVPAATVRSYLHRFKQRQLIDSVGGRWKLRNPRQPIEASGGQELDC